MSRRQYTIILQPEPEEGGYPVLVPALPGCFTQGETVQKCMERAKEAIALHIEGLLADGEPIPEDEVGAVLAVVQVEVPAASTASSKRTGWASTWCTSRRRGGSPAWVDPWCRMVMGQHEE
jgi:antitoxin HicB